MKAYWSYGKITLPLMTYLELYYIHSDINARKIVTGMHESIYIIIPFRLISNLTAELKYHTFRLLTKQTTRYVQI